MPISATFQTRRNGLFTKDVVLYVNSAEWRTRRDVHTGTHEY